MAVFIGVEIGIEIDKIAEDGEKWVQTELCERVFVSYKEKRNK